MFYELSWTAEVKQQCIDGFAEQKEVTLELKGISQKLIESVSYFEGPKKIQEFLRDTFWKAEIEAKIQTGELAAEKPHVTAQWQDLKADKGSPLIAHEVSQLGDIKHQSVRLDDEQTYQVKLARRILKRGYASLCMLDGISPFLPLNKQPLLKVVYQNIYDELQCLNDVAEAFCFSIATKESSDDLDKESVYFHQQYNLSASGWAKRMSKWLWQHFSDVSELVGVALEFASSGQGVEGNTNAQNFETLQAFIKNPEQFEKNLAAGKVGYTQDNETKEAEYAHYADGGQLATTLRQLTKQFETPQFVEKIITSFNLSEQLRSISVSRKFPQTLSSLKSPDGLARNLGLYLLQAQELLKGVSVDAMEKVPDDVKNEGKLLLNTWGVASEKYIGDLLPDVKQNLAPKQKMIIRRSTKRVRIKQKSTLKADNTQVYEHILQHENKGMEWLNTSLKMKCYIPPDHHHEATASVERRLRLNRRLS